MFLQALCRVGRRQHATLQPWSRARARAMPRATTGRSLGAEPSSLADVALADNSLKDVAVALELDHCAGRLVHKPLHLSLNRSAGPTVGKHLSIEPQPRLSVVAKRLGDLAGGADANRAPARMPLGALSTGGAVRGLNGRKTSPIRRAVSSTTRRDITRTNVKRDTFRDETSRKNDRASHQPRARSSGEIPLPDNDRCRSCRSSRWLGVRFSIAIAQALKPFIGRESDPLVVCDAPKPRFLPVDAALPTAAVAASVAPDVVEDHRVRHPARSGVGDRVAGALHSGGQTGKRFPKC